MKPKILTAETNAQSCAQQKGLARRELAALGLSSAAVLALTACGPDRGGLEAKELPADEAGTVALDDLAPWSTTLVNFGGQRAFVAVVRSEGEEVKGWEAYCTHQGCALTVQGPVLDCPCHGSTFDAQTGEPNGGPAQTALIEVALKVENGRVGRA